MDDLTQIQMDGAGETSADEAQPVEASAAWLQMARDAYEQSTDWFDISLRPVVEKAMAHFGNRHAPGSKYHSESYKFRSKGFRPKTRASIRRNEAAAAVAFFSTEDMVSITAENQDDKGQVIAAAVVSELLNYRLDDAIPWFLTLIAGYQSALNVGVVISHQCWEFEEDIQQMPAVSDTGEMVLDESGEIVMQEVRRTLTDKPCVDLVPIENIRISPASDWRNAMDSTPYIVELIPMFIGDIRKKMTDGKWTSYADGEIQTAAAAQYDSIRAAREGQRRTDPQDVNHATSDFDTVFVHRNVIRKDGEDWLYYTLGTQLMLSDPKPLREDYRFLRKGERPYVMGFAVIEAHKAYPVGLNEMTFTLQEEANEINNQRRDNVALVMNKRYFARRNANIDYKSVTRNVPGSITLMDDLNDIKWDNPGEVTQSSYAEQDRVNVDYDELAGTFSPGSVQSNRKLNETVGGMNLLSNDANVITEYQLRVFSETWVEPVLKQLVRMEQAYETDAVVLAIAGGRANMHQKYGVNQVTDAMLQGMVTVRVNVGFGATNPQQRVQRLAMGLNTVGNFAPYLMQGMDAKEIVTEVFGALGYKGAERFFPQLGKEQNPQIMALQKEIQRLSNIIAGKQVEQQGRVQVETIRQEGENTRTQWRAQAELELAKMKLAIEAIDARLGSERNQIDIGRLENERAAIVHQMRLKEREVWQPDSSMTRVLMNDRYNLIPGRVG